MGPKSTALAMAIAYFVATEFLMVNASGLLKFAMLTAFLYIALTSHSRRASAPAPERVSQ